MKSILKLFLLIIIILIPSILSAWPIENGVAVCTALNEQRGQEIISDGNGGAIICWYDYRNGVGIYAQRMSNTDLPLWTLDGVAICTGSYNRFYSKIVSDGSGGAIITWNDLRDGTTYDIYAQRVNSSGSTLWTNNGIPICTASGDQKYPEIVFDGNGGAIIAWQDYRFSEVTSDIYAQRINSAGSTLWALNGIGVCTVDNNQVDFNVTSDNQGGAIFAWIDNRSPDNYTYRTYVQRINPDGSTIWSPNGYRISTTFSQTMPAICSDGMGGAYVVWVGPDSSYSSGDIYAQRINSVGSTENQMNAIVICSAQFNQVYPQIISSDDGTAIICWEDWRSIDYPDIYAQKINSVGSTLWTVNGIPVCTDDDYQNAQKLISDGYGGAIITWEDTRGTTAYDIYIQRVDAIGNCLWTTNGVVLSNEYYSQQWPSIASDGYGGAIVSWEQVNHGFDSDIYVQQIDYRGSIGKPTIIPKTLWDYFE